MKDQKEIKFTTSEVTGKTNESLTKENSLSVEITPSKDVKAAVKSLKPVNATDLKSVINDVYQIEPAIKDADGHDRLNVLSCDGKRDVRTNGMYIAVHKGKADEFVRIETDEGENILTGEIYKSTHGTCDAIFEGYLDPGKYWFVIQSRMNDDNRLIRARHRIEVVE